MKITQILESGEGDEMRINLRETELDYLADMLKKVKAQRGKQGYQGQLGDTRLTIYCEVEDESNFVFYHYLPEQPKPWRDPWYRKRNKADASF